MSKPIYIFGGLTAMPAVDETRSECTETTWEVSIENEAGDQEEMTLDITDNIVKDDDMVRYVLAIWAMPKYNKMDRHPETGEQTFFDYDNKIQPTPGKILFRDDGAKIAKSIINSVVWIGFHEEDEETHLVFRVSVKDTTLYYYMDERQVPSDLINSAVNKYLRDRVYGYMNRTQICLLCVQKDAVENGRPTAIARGIMPDKCYVFGMDSLRCENDENCPFGQYLHRDCATWLVGAGGKYSLCPGCDPEKFARAARKRPASGGAGQASEEH